MASHVFPEVAAAIDAIDVDARTSSDALLASLRACLVSRPGEETLILVDAFGATPCNVAMNVADGVRVRVVAGVNVPMLWRTLCYREEPLAALVERAVAGAVQGVMHVAVPRRQNQSSSVGLPAHGQVEHSHQQ